MEKDLYSGIGPPPDPKAAAATCGRDTDQVIVEFRTDDFAEHTEEGLASNILKSRRVRTGVRMVVK
jgi:hypothetical protein